MPDSQVTVEQQRHDAARTICDLAGNADDAIAPLQALGLIPSDGVDRRWDTIGVAHGSRSAVEWHHEQTNPQHHTLCAPCRRYVDVQARSAKGPNLRITEGG